MVNKKNTTLLSLFIAVSFFAAGCEKSTAATKLQNDVAILNQAIEKKDEEITALNARLTSLAESNQQRSNVFGNTLVDVNEEVKALRSELISLKKGELVSFKTSLTEMQKELDAMRGQLRKIEEGSKTGPEGIEGVQAETVNTPQ